jgi:hypothetical protein
MPGRKPTPRPRRRSGGTARPRVAAAPSHQLLVIDHERLQRAAWADFLAARSRLDHAARSLHRYEEIDVPAYNAWLHRTFPLEVTSLRELRDEATAKANRIRIVKTIAAKTGASPKWIWREQKESNFAPQAFRKKSKAEHESEDEESAEASARRDARREDFAEGRKARRPAVAREIYRRLVQRLHPDRGGGWSAPRQHLWHEVQLAWASGDADWLARLEIEWETAHDAIGPRTQLSRLRAALQEISAAWRDTEAKLHRYRSSLPWRFTLMAARREALGHRVQADFARQFRMLQRQLGPLNATIAEWEEDWTRADSSPHPKRRRRPVRPYGRAW